MYKQNINNPRNNNTIENIASQCGINRRQALREFKTNRTIAEIQSNKMSWLTSSVIIWSFLAATVFIETSRSTQEVDLFISETISDSSSEDLPQRFKEFELLTNNIEKLTREKRRIKDTNKHKNRNEHQKRKKESINDIADDEDDNYHVRYSTKFGN